MPFAEWYDNQDLEMWRRLPPNVVCNEDVLEAVTQHFALSLVQAAVVDGYWEQRFEPMLSLFSRISADQKAHYCDRWNFISDYNGYAPHFDRNFIAATLFKDDREEVPLIQVLWNRLGPYPMWLTERARRQRVLWVLFVRRVFHQWPPGFASLMEWLLPRICAPGFNPKTSRFAEELRAFLLSHEPSNLYGRGSHWFAISVQVLRALSNETYGWVEDSVALVIALWTLAGFLDDIAGSGAIHERTSMCCRMVAGDGLSTYAAKFFLQSMRGLYRHIGPIRSGWRMVSFEKVAPIGPALGKFVQATTLFTMASLPAPLSEKLVNSLEVELTRYIFAAVVRFIAGGPDRSLGYYMHELLVKRHFVFPARARLFDLQDTQARICGILMVTSEASKWFDSWGGFSVIQDGRLAQILLGSGGSIMHALNSGACARREKRKLHKPVGLCFLFGGRWFQTYSEFCRNNGLSNSRSTSRAAVYNFTYSPADKLILLDHTSVRRADPGWANGQVDVSGVADFMAWTEASGYQKQCCRGDSPRHCLLIAHSAMKSVAGL